MSTDIETIRETHERATLENETARLQAETAQISGQVFPGMVVEEPMTLMESIAAWGEMVDPMDYPFNDHYGRPTASQGARLGDRRDGDMPPVFRTEMELHNIRGIARVLFDKFVTAKAALGNLSNYCLGTGFKYKLVPMNKDDKLLADVAGEILGDFIECDDWTGTAENERESREEELFRRNHRDGESFLALYHVGGGRTVTRILEPEQITEPDDPRQVEEAYHLEQDRIMSWKYGVHTDELDIENVHGYFARWQTQHHQDIGRYFDAGKMCHFKLNTDSTIKRGISDFYPIYEALEDTSKLLRNTIRGHAVMSAIAYIRQHAKGVTQSQVQTMRSSQAWNQYVQPTMNQGSRNRFQHKFDPGTILDVPKGQEYKASPMAEQGVGKAMVTIEQAALQVIGTRWSMPTWMMSASTGQTAYASALVAESPFVKFCLRLQQRYKGYFASVMWKVLRIAHTHGLFDRFGITFAELKKALRLNIEPPIVEARDRNIQTNRRKVLHDSGILSAPTWTAEEGYDHGKEQAQGAKVTQMGAPFAGGDQPGQSMEDGAPVAAGKPQPPAAKYESHSNRLQEAAAMLWGNYPAMGGVPCPTDVTEGNDV